MVENGDAHEGECTNVPVAQSLRHIQSMRNEEQQTKEDGTESDAVIASQ